MRLTEITYTNAPPIDSYGPGFFRIGGQVFEGPQLVLPTGVFGWGGYDDTDRIIAAAGQIDVLFLGTGPETAFAPTAFRELVEAAGPGVEPMASPAACRTYNVLLAEGRRIGLAMFPV